MIKYFMLLILLIVGFSSNATDLIYGIGSYHYDRSLEMHEVNPALGIQTDDGFSLIYVTKNSINKPSIQVSFSEKMVKLQDLSIGYRVGIATGYNDKTYYREHRFYEAPSYNYKGILPIIALELEYKMFSNVYSVLDITQSTLFYGIKYTL